MGGGWAWLRRRQRRLGRGTTTQIWATAQRQRLRGAGQRVTRCWVENRGERRGKTAGGYRRMGAAVLASTDGRERNFGVAGGRKRKEKSDGDWVFVFGL
ncbi:hypothetical protein Csa_008684, partial [Cucumis sativus]